MIATFVERWEASKKDIEQVITTTPPENYKELVTIVVKAIQGERFKGHNLDPERIVEIDQGDYQGTLLYVIPCKGYQPSDYYAVKVNYGSCSGCDSLQWALDCTGERRSQALMTMALHIVQGLKEI